MQTALNFVLFFNSNSFNCPLKEAVGQIIFNVSLVSPPAVDCVRPSPVLLFTLLRDRLGIVWVHHDFNVSCCSHRSPYAYLHMVGMLWFMSDINPLS